jgi:hypothetical protein
LTKQSIKVYLKNYSPGITKLNCLASTRNRKYPARLRGDPKKYEDLLVIPITLNHVKEVTRLNGIREKLLTEAKKLSELQRKP